MNEIELSKEDGVGVFVDDDGFTHKPKKTKPALDPNSLEARTADAMTAYGPAQDHLVNALLTVDAAREHLPADATKMEEDLRAALAARNVGDQFDSLAEDLASLHGTTVLRVVVPVVDERTPPWKGGPLTARTIAPAVGKALDLLLDDRLSPRKLGQELSRAQKSYEKQKADAEAKAKVDAVERIKAQRHGLRIETWTKRNPITRALIRLAEHPEFHPSAKLLRALAHAIEIEHTIAKQLPPNDADLRPLVEPESKPKTET